MNELSEYILNNFKVRKNKKQKTSFIHYLEKNLSQKNYPVSIESSGLFNNRNIVVGDVDTADIVLSAHYDTCATMPIPNLITPKSILIYILYQLAIVIVIFGVAGIVGRISYIISSNYIIQMFLFAAISLGFCYQIMAGKANKNNYNDNTSGVITLLEVACNLPEDLKNRVAFVFFDNEELGLLGSSAFAKKHKKVMKDKLLVNFDCVSDGDHILFIANKKVRKDKKLYEKVKNSMIEQEGKNIMFTSSGTTFYPSDQMNFKKYIGVAALKKAPLIGLYMNRIHTNKDINFDENNILLLSRSLIEFIHVIKE